MKLVQYSVTLKAFVSILFRHEPIKTDDTESTESDWVNSRRYSKKGRNLSKIPRLVHECSGRKITTNSPKSRKNTTTRSLPSEVRQIKDSGGKSDNLPHQKAFLVAHTSPTGRIQYDLQQAHAKVYSQDRVKDILSWGSQTSAACLDNIEGAQRQGQYMASPMRYCYDTTKYKERENVSEDDAHPYYSGRTQVNYFTSYGAKKTVDELREGGKHYVRHRDRYGNIQAWVNSGFINNGNTSGSLVSCLSRDTNKKAFERKRVRFQLNGGMDMDHLYDTDVTSETDIDVIGRQTSYCKPYGQYS